MLWAFVSQLIPFVGVVLSHNSTKDRPIQKTEYFHSNHVALVSSAGSVVGVCEHITREHLVDASLLLRNKLISKLSVCPC